MANFVYEIKCPHCGENFSVNANEYQSITEQIKEQVCDHIRQEVKAEQEAAMKMAIEKVTAEMKAEKAAADAVSTAEIAKRDHLIAAMQERARSAETEKALAVKTATEEFNARLQRQEAEIYTLKGQIQTQAQTAKLQETLLKDKYEATLRLKDEEIKQIKDYKSKLSTKALGESFDL